MMQKHHSSLLHLYINYKRIARHFYSIFTGDKNTLPKDRESLFVANVKSVSAIAPEMKDKNTLQFAMKTRLKLFWRPAQLAESDAMQAFEKITFRRTGERLMAKNPTPFYVSFGELSVGNTAVPVVDTKATPGALSMMVAPFSEKTFIPKAATVR